MRKIKLAIGLIITGFLALLVLQNKAYFFNKVTFRLDFYYKSYELPEVYTALIFLAVFLLGLFISYIFNLLGQYKSKKTLKNLNMTLRSQMEVISDLKSEIATKDARIEQLSQQNNTAKPEAQMPSSPDADVSETAESSEEEEKKVS